MISPQNDPAPATSSTRTSAARPPTVACGARSTSCTRQASRPAAPSSTRIRCRPLRDGIREYQPDEIIISTHPEVRSGWLRGNLIDRARKAAGDIPVEHVVVDLDAEPRERAHVLVIGRQTVVGEPLVQAVRERAQPSPAEFTVVVPADPPGAEERMKRTLAGCARPGSRRRVASATSIPSRRR